MKNTVAFMLFGISFSVLAEQTTIPNSGETVEGNTKYCFYSNGGHDFTTTTSVHSQCPAVKTFDLDDEE